MRYGVLHRKNLTTCTSYKMKGEERSEEHEAKICGAPKALPCRWIAQVQYQKCTADRETYKNDREALVFCVISGPNTHFCSTHSRRPPAKRLIYPRAYTILHLPVINILAYAQPSQPHRLASCMSSLSIATWNVVLVFLKKTSQKRCAFSQPRISHNPSPHLTTSQQMRITPS